MDEEIRGYERALLRAGKAPREVAAGLLGAKEPDQFLLVIEAPVLLGDPRPGLTTEAAIFSVSAFGEERTMPAQRVHFLRQGIYQGLPIWRNGWAAPMLTVLELTSWLAFFAGRGYDFMVWDARTRSRALDHGMNASDLRAGWREGEVSDPQATGGGGDLSVPQAVLGRSPDGQVLYVGIDGQPRWGFTGGSVGETFGHARGAD